MRKTCLYSIKMRIYAKKSNNICVCQKKALSLRSIKMRIYAKKSNVMQIDRPIYLQKLINRQHNGMIKIITGLRRCGKSYLLFNLFRQYLLDSKVPANHIITIDLENYDNYSLRNPREMLDFIGTKVKDNEWHYILIDEVQHMEHFEDVLNTLLKRGQLDVYVTGSNARFLSQDVVTTFRGRGDEIHVRPFCFKEYQSAHSEQSYNTQLTEYMIYGGMPQLTILPSDEQKEEYLKSLVAETYIKDIRERYNIQNDNDLEELINLIASSIGSFQNPLKLQNTFKTIKQSALSQDTIKHYLDYLQDAFLIEKAIRYDIKGKRYISTPQKYYFEDLGLRNARLNFRQNEPTHAMENMIYNELRVRGLSIDVGQVVQNTKNTDGISVRKSLEVDFVCNKGYRRLYIQSAYSMPSYEKIKQELLSLTHIKDEFAKVIITADMTPTHQMDNGVLILNLQDFLTKTESLPL